MKDNKILLLIIPMLLFLAFLITLIFYDNYNTNKINTELKKEIRDKRVENKKLKKEKLQLIIKGE